MSWQQVMSLIPPPPDMRPIPVVEQEILDELEFHIEMRTLDNVSAGMPATEARQNAIRRFGDFERIHKACRQTLLGERIMLQRVQAVLTLVLLGAVIYMGVAFYRGQQANEAATALMLQKLNQVAKPPVATSPEFEALESATLDQLFPRDAKLTEVQRGFRDWSEGTFPALDMAWWEKLSPAEKTIWEEKWLKQLASSSEKKREVAIQCLAGAGCKKAIPEVLKIAAERVEKDNADRHKAVRALGILGDQSLVPELVPLTYHYNMNTRLEAQVALVRLTGENFGHDVVAWKTWWEKQGGTPPISEKPVVWATSSWMLSMLKGAEDPKKQDEMDRQFTKQGKSIALTQASRISDNLSGPSVIQTVPKTGDNKVDPSLTEIRVTYNKEMSDGSWSWCTGDDTASFPKIIGNPHYEADKKTCVVSVKLEPGKSYVLWMNRGEYRNFKDARGESAVPYLLQFTTRK